MRFLGPMALLLILSGLAPGTAASYLMGIQDADLVCDESPNMQFPKECDNGLPSLPDCLGSGATVDGLGELGVTVEAWVTPPDALGTAYCMEIISPFNVAVPVAVASETLTHSL